MLLAVVIAATIWILDCIYAMQSPQCASKDRISAHEVLKFVLIFIWNPNHDSKLITCISIYWCLNNCSRKFLNAVIRISLKFSYSNKDRGRHFNERMAQYYAWMSKGHHTYIITWLGSSWNGNRIGLEWNHLHASPPVQKDFVLCLYALGSLEEELCSCSYPGNHRTGMFLMGIVSSLGESGPKPSISAYIVILDLCYCGHTPGGSCSKSHVLQAGQVRESAKNWPRQFN